MLHHSNWNPTTVTICTDSVEATWGGIKEQRKGNPGAVVSVQCMPFWSPTPLLPNSLSDTYGQGSCGCRCNMPGVLRPVTCKDCIHWRLTVGCQLLWMFYENCQMPTLLGNKAKHTERKKHHRQPFKYDRSLVPYCSQRAKLCQRTTEMSEYRRHVSLVTSR